ncbi:MAG: PDZ domain-containing protein [Sporolactobacillus sp.]|jgi:hypothetical protein|nr:PDZ domain-containing protein [Sporolactobacillus sp.]
MAAILRSVLLGIGYFFCNPLFYLLLAGLFLFSAQRVKRERRSFRVKAYGMFNTIFRSTGPSLIVGAAGSAVLLISGAALPAGALALVSAMYLLIMVTTQLRFLSPAIAGGAALCVAYIFPNVRTSFPLLNGWIADIRGVDFISFGIFVAVGILTECLLVYGWGARQTSPRLIRSRRGGGLVGAHEASELWIVPLLLLVPSVGPLHSTGWWPLLSGTGPSFGFALFPLGVGISQLITHTLPRLAIRRTGHWLLITAALFIAVVVCADVFRLPVLTACGGLFILISRLALVYYQHWLRENRPFYFIMPKNGLRVVGVVPHSLGDRMGVRPGEEILRVNDIDIRSTDDFYQALQKHAAYCKLEVIDAVGEPRFTKGAIHQDDGYKIGLLFLESDRWNQLDKSKP